MNRISYITLKVLAFVLVVGIFVTITDIRSAAAACVQTGSGTWSATASFTGCSGAASAGAGTGNRPGAGEALTANAGLTLTVDVNTPTIASYTISTSGVTATTLTINSGASLTISGTFTVPQTTGASTTQTFSILGTLDVGALTFTGTTTNRNTTISIDNAAGKFTLRGTMTVSSGGTKTVKSTAAGTVELISATVPNTSTLTWGTFAAGTNLVNTSGSSSIAKTTAIATWGNCTITAGTLTTAALYTCTGNLTNNGTWAGTGGVTLSNASASISGTGSITNSGTITISGATAPTLASGSSQTFNNLTLAANALFTVNGTLTISNALTIAASTTASKTPLTIGSTGNLTVTGITTFNLPTAAITATVSVGAGTATFGGLLTMTGSTASAIGKISLTTGTLNFNAGIATGPNGSGTYNVAADHVIDISGDAGTLSLKGQVSTGTSANASGWTFTNTTCTNGGGTFIYADIGASQNVNMPGVGGYCNLTVLSNEGILGAAITTSTVKGNINIGNNTDVVSLNNIGFGIAGNTGKTFTVHDLAKLRITGGSEQLPTGFTVTYDANSTVEFDTTAGFTLISGKTYGNIAFKPTTAGLTFTLPATITINGGIIIGDGTNAVTVNANTNDPTLNIPGTFTINNGGTFVASSLNALTVGGVMTIGGGTSGTFTENGGNIDLNSDLVINAGATFTKNTASQLIFSEGAAQTITDNTAGQDLGSIVTNTTGTSVSTLTNIMGGDLTIGAGTTFSIASDTLTLTDTSGTLITNSGTFTTTGSTIAITGTGTKTFATGISSINNLTLSSSGTNNLNILSDLTLAGSLTNNSPSVLTANTANLIITGSVTNAGTITSSYTSGLISIGGDWINSGTVNAGTSTIKMTSASASPVVFDGGGATYNNVWFAHGTGTGSIEIRGTNTFADFKDDGTASHTLLFAAGTTTTLATFTVTGDASHTITISSSDGAGNASTATHALVKTGGGTISSDYLNIQHSVATPTSTWYAGTHSTNNNDSVATTGSGWTFTAATNDGLPYGGTAWSIPGTVQAEDFNTGGEGVGYHDVDTSNAAGQYRPSEGVDIEAVQNDTGSYDVGWTANGEWLKYTINVTTTDTYVFNMRAASPSAGGQFQIEVDGSVLGTGTVPQTGSYQTWQTVAVPNISLTAGQHILRIILVNPNYNLNYFTISNNISPTVNAGTDQSITLPTSSTTLTGTASDSDGTIASYAWSEQFGPNNATFGSQTSASTTISGLIEGSYIFRLTVTDNGGATAYDDVNVVVNPDLSTTTYYVDFGLSTIQTSASGWNNLSDTTTSGPTLTLVDSTGATTTRTLHITDSFYYNSGAGMDPSMNQNGTSSSTLYPANATHDSFFLGTLNSITDTSAQITVGGLSNANTYDFKFYASRVAGDAGNRTTDYTIGATTVSLNATDNVDNSVQITGVSPSSGSVVININKNASATFGYLGVLQITEHSAGNASPTANAGNDQSVTMPVSSITLSGSGSDTDGTIASYAWSEVSSNYATINSPTSATTTVKDLAAGTYTFRLTVTDNQGATGTDDIVVTVASHNLTTPTAKTIVILGSSTSAGYGITPASDAYANRFSAYFDGLVASNNVINLAVSGYTTYQLLPTGSSTANRPAPDTAKNITAALTYSPAAILVNLPSNDTANGYSVSEQETNFQTMASTAAAAGVPIYFTTTQPRNNFTAGQVTDQTTVRDWILSTYGTNAIDFWTTFAQGDGTINPIYDQGDGIHLNNIAHKKLYARVAESTMINAAHNISPTANAGVDQSIYLPTTTTTLSGSGSDTDGTIASYAWSFISGPVTPTISSASTASTGITGLSNTGTYVFRLTVTDNLGKTGADDISVVVNPVSTGCISQGTGNWNTTGTWSCGHVPTTGDDVTIATGHTVSIDVDPATLGAIVVNGTLNTGSHSIAGASLTVNASGTFYTGGSAVTMSGDITNSGTFSASPWQNYRIITIDHTKVPNTDLTDFPVLINGTYSYLKTTGNGGKVTNASGYDIAFFSDSALSMPLKFEREKWSASTGDLIAWVKIPTLSHTTDTVVYMAYGNSAVTTDQSDKTNVWDSNYKAVWHLNESFTGNGQTLADSTSYAEDLTTHSTSSTYSGGQISGPVGYGISNIKATNDYLSFPQVTLSGAWTLEGWVKVGYADQYSSLISNGSSGGGLIYNTNWYAGLFRLWDGTTDNIVADAAITAGTWNHFVVTRSGTALAMYIGGNPHGTSANGKNAIFQYLAVDGNGNPSTDLQFDEVRLSTAQRSADWVKTEFNNQNSPSTFYSVGVEQSVSTGTNLTVSLSGSWTNTGTFSGGNATIKMTDNSGNPTFAGGGATYNKLWLAPGTGTGSYTISGNNTFTELKDDGTAAHTIKFTTGSTQTLTTWNVSGTSGNLITIDSTTTGVHNLVKPNDAPEVRADYLSIKHSVATPYGEWYAGENSVDNQSLASAGSGWVFTTRSKHRGGGGSVRSAGGETDNGTGAGTCSDQIQNGNETGVDSGGRCANTGGGAGGGGTVDNGTGAGTCSDGIKNGDETGIDSGGRCANTGGGSGGGGGDVGFLFFFQQIALPSMSMWFAFR